MFDNNSEDISEQLNSLRKTEIYDKPEVQGWPEGRIQEPRNLKKRRRVPKEYVESYIRAFFGKQSCNKSQGVFVSTGKSNGWTACAQTFEIWELYEVYEFQGRYIVNYIPPFCQLGLCTSCKHDFKFPWLIRGKFVGFIECLILGKRSQEWENQDGDLI